MSTWALVTGASRGIGAATAVALAEQGRDVIVHCASAVADAEKVAARCAELGADTRVVAADLAEDCDVVVEAIDEVGGLAVLVNNAGITADGLALSMTDEAFQRTWQVNTAPAFTLSRAALRGMLRRRSGRIVNVTSVVGLHGNAGQANYAASKAGLVGLTKSLAREVARRGITVNAVAPGFVRTAMTDALPDGLADSIPAGRVGEAAEIADAIAFLTSDRAAYINGTVLQVDGGLFA